MLKATLLIGSLAAVSSVSWSITPGVYKGEAEKGYACIFGKCAMRVKVTSEAIVHADNTVDVKGTYSIKDVTGKAKLLESTLLDCPKEPYTLLTDPGTAKHAALSAAPIVLHNYPQTASSTGTCIVNALPPTVSLGMLTYDARQERIHMKIGPVGVNVQAKLVQQLPSITPGVYRGSAEKELACVFGKCNMRVKVQSEVVVNTDNTLHVKGTYSIQDITGTAQPVKTTLVDCANEPYTIRTDSATAKHAAVSAAPIVLHNYPQTASSTSTCIINSLPKTVSIGMLTYDAGQQQIRMIIGPEDIEVKAALQPKGQEAVGTLTHMRRLRGLMPKMK